MKARTLILQEALHRRLSSVLILLVLTATVALPVAILHAGDASHRETIRLMRDLGYNLRIIPKRTDLAAFWRRGYSSHTLPQDSVQRFASRPDLSYNHLIAMLHERIEWEGLPVILTGLATEVSPKGKKKSSMIFRVTPGTLHLGHTVASKLGVSRGDTVKLRGRDYEIAATLAETGTPDDIRVYSELSDAQGMLGKTARINEIQALECHCADPAIDTLPKLREQLETVVPEGMVLRERDIAVSRKRTRQMNSRFVATLVSASIVVGAFLLAMIFVWNVAQRRREIGTLRAVGHPSSFVATLFLGKALAFGLVAGVLGFAIGAGFAYAVGPAVFGTTVGQVQVVWWLLPVTILATALFSVLSALVPTAQAVTFDPAVQLAEDH